MGRVGAGGLERGYVCDRLLSIPVCAGSTSGPPHIDPRLCGWGVRSGMEELTQRAGLPSGSFLFEEPSFT